MSSSNSSSDIFPLNYSKFKLNPCMSATSLLLSRNSLIDQNNNNKNTNNNNQLKGSSEEECIIIDESPNTSTEFIPSTQPITKINDSLKSIDQEISSPIHQAYNKRQRSDITQLAPSSSKISDSRTFPLMNNNNQYNLNDDDDDPTGFVTNIRDMSFLKAIPVIKKPDQIRISLSDNISHSQRIESSQLRQTRGSANQNSSKRIQILVGSQTLSLEPSVAKKVFTDPKLSQFGVEIKLDNLDPLLVKHYMAKKAEVQNKNNKRVQKKIEIKYIDYCPENDDLFQTEEKDDESSNEWLNEASKSSKTRTSTRKRLSLKPKPNKSINNQNLLLNLNEDTNMDFESSLNKNIIGEISNNNEILIELSTSNTDSSSNLPIIFFNSNESSSKSSKEKSKSNNSYSQFLDFSLPEVVASNNINQKKPQKQDPIKQTLEKIKKRKNEELLINENSNSSTSSHDYTLKSKQHRLTCLSDSKNSNLPSKSLKHKLNDKNKDSEQDKIKKPKLLHLNKDSGLKKTSETKTSTPTIASETIKKSTPETNSKMSTFKIPRLKATEQTTTTESDAPKTSNADSKTTTPKSVKIVDKNKKDSSSYSKNKTKNQDEQKKSANATILDQKQKDLVNKKNELNKKTTVSSDSSTVNSEILTLTELAQIRSKFNQMKGFKVCYFNIVPFMLAYVKRMEQFMALDLNILVRNLPRKYADYNLEFLSSSNEPNQEKPTDSKYTQLCKLISRSSGRLNFYQMLGFDCALREFTSEYTSKIVALRKNKPYEHNTPFTSTGELDVNFFLCRIGDLTLSESYVFLSRMKCRLTMPYKTIEAIRIGIFLNFYSAFFFINHS
jgi:hypothetical protein